MSEAEILERTVRYIVTMEEHYRFETEPLTPDHVFGEHVMSMEQRKMPLMERSRAHQEQRIRAITASAKRDLGIA